MAGSASCAKMLAMNPPVTSSSAQSLRRFVLLPEQGNDESSQGPRIRRYRLAGVGRRSGMSEIDVVSARMARELGRLGRR
jgi:hypothetical protein